MPTHNGGADLSKFSLSQLAELTGHDRRTVRARLRGLSPIDRNGSTLWYSPRAALEAIFLPGAIDPQQERARLDRARREEIERRALGTDKSVQASIDRVVVAFAKVTRDKILSVPHQAHVEIAAITSQEIARRIGYVIDRYLRAALADLADEGDAEIARLESGEA